MLILLKECFMCILLPCFYPVFDNNASHFSYCDLQFAEIKKKRQCGEQRESWWSTTFEIIHKDNLTEGKVQYKDAQYAIQPIIKLSVWVWVCVQSSCVFLWCSQFLLQIWYGWLELLDEHRRWPWRTNQHSLLQACGINNVLSSLSLERSQSYNVCPWQSIWDNQKNINNLKIA